MSVILENISEDLYRNIEGMPIMQKKSSARFEEPIENIDINPDRVKLKQSLANFGEGIKYCGSMLIKLNNMRIISDKRLDNIESFKYDWISKKDFEVKITALKNELLAKVLV